MGFELSRSLWQMRRSLHAPLPAVSLPEGVAVRTFQAGRDDEAWVRVNAAAFRAHPEQGHWTVDDLHRRMREPWFDPEGFFLAHRGDDLVGLPLDEGPRRRRAPTTHPAGPHAHEGHGHDPIGEVYVVGVAPGETGTGLGKALTVTGLRHLRHRGLPSAMLYVDSDNEAAIGLYTKLGFIRWETDLMFSRA